MALPPGPYLPGMFPLAPGPTHADGPGVHPCGSSTCSTPEARCLSSRMSTSLRLRLPPAGREAKGKCMSENTQSDVLWIGDPGALDAPDERRATYVGPAKAFCPCDTGNPQDCKPEEWRPAHSPRPPCERCGAPLHGHQGNYCRRPTPWTPPEARCLSPSRRPTHHDLMIAVGWLLLLLGIAVALLGFAPLARAHSRTGILAAGIIGVVVAVLAVVRLAD